jgi:hypothetical protein
MYCPNKEFLHIAAGLKFGVGTKLHLHSRVLRHYKLDAGVAVPGAAQHIVSSFICLDPSREVNNMLGCLHQVECRFFSCPAVHRVRGHAMPEVCMLMQHVDASRFYFACRTQVDLTRATMRHSSDAWDTVETEAYSQSDVHARGNTGLITADSWDGWTHHAAGGINPLALALAVPQTPT